MAPDLTVAASPDLAVAADLTVPPDRVALPDLGGADLVANHALEARERGTCTSVQASDGHTLGGVHHEDEALPPFVQRRNWLDRNNYFFEQLPEEPLQQLETPVLYFRSKKAQPITVRVDFPRGVIGQRYPSASRFAPALGDELWAPSRNVDSTPVRSGGQDERFIFYRGLAA